MGHTEAGARVSCVFTPCSASRYPGICVTSPFLPQSWNSTVVSFLATVTKGQTRTISEEEKLV